VVASTALVEEGMNILDRVAELIFGPTPDPAAWERAEYKAASARWAERNQRAREAGCRCGRPATEVRYDHRNIGSVPVEFWTCTDHVDVEQWRSQDGGRTWHSEEIIRARKGGR
jgi:hypothetical protein